MSGQFLGQILGNVIGFLIGGPIGAMIGGSLGGAIGSSFDKLPTQYGPRLDDLRPQSSTYGNPIPLVYGTVALQGTVIWAKEIEEVKHEEEVGGGGLFGGPSQKVVTYEYFGTFAVAVCEGPAKGILRIWAGPEKRLIYDGIAMEGGTFRMYLGTEDQMPDPLIGAPAYRGTAYVMIEHFPLKNDGNRLPFLTIEVSTGDDGGTCGTGYDVIGNPLLDNRLYDVPPVKLGNYGSGTDEAKPRFMSDGAHPYAFDADGNLYVCVRGQTGSYPNERYYWYVKKVSTTDPIHEDLVYLGDSFNHIFGCSIAYDPNRDILGVIQVGTTNFSQINCGTFTASSWPLAFQKVDIIYSEFDQNFRTLNSRSEILSNGEPDLDNFGVVYSRGSKLIDCGPNGIAIVANGSTFMNGKALVDKGFDFYDPVRSRLLSVTGYFSSFTGYYDFETMEVVTPNELGPPFRLNAAYFPMIDRVVWNDASGMNVMNPADFSVESFPDECDLFHGKLLYQDGSPVAMDGGILYPVPIPNVRTRFVVITAGNWNLLGMGNDIFTFSVGARGKGVSLASIVADLSHRAGESRYDVGQLEDDTVDGYVIARQTEVRAAIEALRPAYYFDAVESQGIIKYVKRGGNAVAVIADDDLAARDAGSEAGDPLKTVRRMEVELPRAVNVKYMLAADDYNQAAKQARRLIGSSGDEQTIDVPLVLTDTKAQEVAEVNLHASWAERLSYEFSLPRKYSYLEPTDLIVVKGHLMRLTKVTATPRGVLQCEAVADETTYYAPHVVVTETQPKDQTVAKPAITLMELF